MADTLLKNRDNGSPSNTDPNKPPRHIRYENVLNLCVNEYWLMPEKNVQAILNVITEGEGDMIKVAELNQRYQRYTDEVNISNGVAVVPIHGTILPRATLFSQISGGVSTEGLRAELTALDNNPNVKGIILHIDSPGGASAGLSELGQYINAHITKPIFSYVTGMAGSGAYWLGASTDKVYAEQGAFIGSVGAIVQVKPTKDNKFITITSRQSPYKAMDVTTEQGKLQLQTQLDDLAQVFIDQVAEFRGVESAYVEQSFGKGEMMIAAKAQAVDMIDGVKTFQETMNEMLTTIEEITMSDEIKTQLEAAQKTANAEREARAQVEEKLNKLLAQAEEKQRIEAEEKVAEFLANCETKVQSLVDSGRILPKHKDSLTKSLTGLASTNESRAFVMACLESMSEGLAVGKDALEGGKTGQQAVDEDYQKRVQAMVDIGNFGMAKKTA